MRNHIYKITVIHWIRYQPFEQPAPGCDFTSTSMDSTTLRLYTVMGRVCSNVLCLRRGILLCQINTDTRLNIDFSLRLTLACYTSTTSKHRCYMTSDAKAALNPKQKNQTRLYKHTSGPVARLRIGEWAESPSDGTYSCPEKSRRTNKQTKTRKCSIAAESHIRSHYHISSKIGPTTILVNLFQLGLH